MNLAGPRSSERNSQYYKDLLNLEGISIEKIHYRNSISSTTILPFFNISSGKQTSKEVPATIPSISSPTPLTTFITSSPSSSAVLLPSRKSNLDSGPDLGRLVKTTWNDIKELLGFMPNCVNGGTRQTGGACRCPKLFEAIYTVLHFLCCKIISNRCPTPLYIEGAHCENIQCANNAPLRKEANGSWWCDCSDKMFYDGKFCENFSAPYAVFAVPVICFLLFILLIAVCQMDFCPRRRHSPRRSRYNSQTTNGQTRRRIITSERVRGAQIAANGAETNAVTQELLIAEERGYYGRSTAYPPGIVAPYVIRLDTIPTFNPHMIANTVSVRIHNFYIKSN
uniref:EGF-like domain-containing protein n=1 Tax=Heterorhabditis bacteriophora TaxID=37862 RepID=A0A1I7WYE4_HETBA